MGPDSDRECLGWAGPQSRVPAGGALQVGGLVLLAGATAAVLRLRRAGPVAEPKPSGSRGARLQLPHYGDPCASEAWSWTVMQLRRGLTASADALGPERQHGDRRTAPPCREGHRATWRFFKCLLNLTVWEMLYG